MSEILFEPGGKIDVPGPPGTIEKLITAIPVLDAGVVLMPVMNIAAAKSRLKEFQEFVREYLVDGEDFGTIPGTPKPTLLKPGADKLCDLYGMADTYTFKETENWTLDPPLFDYTVTCTLLSRRDQRLIGSGVGSCNSWEGKFKYRESKRKCPLCGQESIIKGKEEYGGGWLCWAKKNGCGAKFLEKDEAIISQNVGKVVNDDVPTLKNTILKMAKKRAKIDAVISVTRSSGIFTQDMEDVVEGAEADTGQGTHAAAQRVLEQKKEELTKKAEKRAPKAPKAEQTYTPSLFYTKTGDKYTINGDEGLMRQLWKQFKDTYMAHGKCYLISDEQLNALQFQCEQGNIPLSQLKAPDGN